jgi:hypothetical protein
MEEKNNNHPTPTSGTSRPGSFIRPLGAFEQMFWLRAQISTVHFLLAGEVEGATKPDEWRKALDTVRQIHPMLSVGIRQDTDTTLFFEHRPEMVIPLRLVAGEGVTRWQEELEKELSIPFDNNDAPLLRVVLIHYPDKCIVVLTAHHAIGDGLSLSYILRDLLAILSGRALTPFPFPASVDVLLGLAAAGPDQDRLKGPLLVNGQTAPRRLWEKTKKPPRIITRQLTPAFTEWVIGRARAEGTTFHAVLMAALLTAGRRVFAKWREKPVRMLSPISVRKTLGIGEDCRLSLCSKFMPFPPEDNQPFWELARFIRLAIADASKRESMIQDTIGLRKFVDGQDIEMADQVSERFNREFVVSNIGRVEYDTEFGRVRLVSIWGPAVHSGFEDEYSVAVASVNGACCLAVTSREPNGMELLEEVLTVLKANCE